MKITFDLDGVIIEHLEYKLNQMKIPIEFINKYSIGKLDLLKGSEKKAILQSFSDVENFMYAEKHSDVLNRLAKRYEIAINSLSCTREIARYKEFWLKSEIKGIKNKDIVLSIIGDGSGNGNKKIGKTDIYVEDSLENLISNIDNFHVGILIDKPYNRVNVKADKIIRAKDIYDAERIIERRIK